jgi:hypothetical protein
MIDERFGRRLATTLSRNENGVVQTRLSKPSPGGRRARQAVDVGSGMVMVALVGSCWSAKPARAAAGRSRSADRARG